MRKVKCILTVLIILAAILLAAGSFYGDFVEYEEIGYTSALITNIIAKSGVYVSVFLVFLTLFFLNLFFVKKNLKLNNEHYGIENHKIAVFFLTFFAAFICAFIIKF